MHTTPERRNGKSVNSDARQSGSESGLSAMDLKSLRRCHREHAAEGSAVFWGCLSASCRSRKRNSETPRWCGVPKVRNIISVVSFRANGAPNVLQFGGGERRICGCPSLIVPRISRDTRVPGFGKATLYDAHTGKLLAEWNPDSRKTPPAWAAPFHAEWENDSQVVSTIAPDVRPAFHP